MGLETATSPATVEDPVPVLNLTVQHGRTLEDARRALEVAVHRVSGHFSTLVRRTQWTPDRQRVKLEGVAFWLEMWVDAEAVHAKGCRAVAQEWPGRHHRRPRHTDRVRRTRLGDRRIGGRLEDEFNRTRTPRVCEGGLGRRASSSRRRLNGRPMARLDIPSL